MLALAFSIPGPFVVNSAPMETQQPVLDEFVSVLAHAFLLWLLIDALSRWLTCQSVPAHVPVAASRWLNRFERLLLLRHFH